MVSGGSFGAAAGHGKSAMAATTWVFMQGRLYKDMAARGVEIRPNISQILHASSLGASPRCSARVLKLIYKGLAGGKEFGGWHPGCLMQGLASPPH